jgi:uncharacterized protein involved in response to NO
VLAVLIADLFRVPAAIGAAALAAAALNALRLNGWRSARTFDTPLLWVLHLGYGWLIVGLALKGVAGLTDLVPANAALHALTVGAIGTMMLAVMSRAALGHTGRPLVAHPVVVASYVMISLAALLRIAAPLAPSAYLVLIEASGVVWSLAFVQFLAIFAPILWQPRVDGKPG